MENNIRHPRYPFNAELIQEGLAREFVSKVQQMRKNADFE